MAVLVNLTLFVLFGRGLSRGLNPFKLTLNVADTYTHVYRVDSVYDESY